jgi:hypothetical protein
VKTVWDTPDIWIRRTFDAKSIPDDGQLMLVAHHDEDAEIYLNGTLVRTFKGPARHYSPTMLDESARKLLRPGQNTIAVHCHQTRGGQYIDVGIMVVSEK